MKDKWQTLMHNGPVFPKAYEYKGFNSDLSPLAEEMLYHYAAKLQTDYVHNEVFNRNFWNALKAELPTSYKTKKFPEEFSDLISEIYTYIQQKKLEKKPDNKEEKLYIKEHYGKAILNGKEQPIASPVIEGPGIFIARGKHPALGSWKYRVVPEDVNINASNIVPPPDGHSWRSCKENKGSMELCSYKIRTSTNKILSKRILFSATSDVKQDSDKKKFEKAIKLIEHWEDLKIHIENNISSSNQKTRQAAIVTWLIMNLGIRVGDEKGEDAADTVGASSLRPEHLILENNILKLHFLGKDSVEYINSIEVPFFIETELKRLLAITPTNQMIFSDVSSGDIKEFISLVVDGITAKVFRTAWGSCLLARGLQNAIINPNMTTTEKVAIFNNCNLEVAKKLNHQRNVGKNYEEKLTEFNAKLSAATISYKEFEKETLKKIEECKNEEQIRKLNEKLLRKQNSLKDMSLRLHLKEDTRNIALGTSKNSYCDPRIGISFCNTYNIPLEKIYSKSAQKKFSWALQVENNYFDNYKLFNLYI